MISPATTLHRIQNVLHKNIPDNEEYRVFLFGSRVHGKVRERSDYDIGILGKRRLSGIIREQIESEFMNIPALIDFVDFYDVSAEFQSQVFEK